MWMTPSTHNRELTQLSNNIISASSRNICQLQWDGNYQIASRIQKGQHLLKVDNICSDRGVIIYALH